ncbi:MAG: hypothetical protein IJV01_06960 [Bacteroidales bacterium]|nr:hypothetical protein [Bacteroidales bacterium]
MRHFFSLCVLSLEALLACGRSEPLPRADVPGRRYPLTVALPPLSRLTGGETLTEGSLTVVAYDAATGLLDAVQTVHGVRSVTLSCTSGEKHIHAFLNEEDAFERPFAREGDEAFRTLSLNFSDSALPFSGAATAQLPLLSSVSVPMRREVARVVLGRIRFDLGYYDAARAPVPPVLRAVYLINIPTVLSGGEPGGWLLGRWHDSATHPLASDEIGLTLTPGQELYGTAHRFYAFPHDGSAYDSRLVVEMSLGGHTLYYSVTLPPLQAGKSYEIAELAITRPGSDDPDTPLVLFDQGIRIEVRDWDSLQLTDGTDF